MDEYDLSYENFLNINKELLNELEGTESYPPLYDLYSYFSKQEPNLINAYRYAEAQLNLSRNLDFLLLNSKINSSHNTIQKIVTTSFRIIHAHYRYRRACGNHEDSACMVGGISYINRTLYKTGLSEDDAICFSEEIKRKTFHPGDKIYRIIEDKKFAIGKWWLQSKPSDFKSWRSDYAVLKSWNQGGLCVEVTLNKDIEVWVGNAAFQVVPMSLDRCYLPGGSEQLLIEPSDLQQLNRKIDPWP